jgi:hypothetical protein
MRRFRRSATPVEFIVALSVLALLVILTLKSI